MAADIENVPDASEASEAELESHRLAKLVDGLIDRKASTMMVTSQVRPSCPVLCFLWLNRYIP